MESRSSAWTPLLAALWVGLTGGALVAFADNLSLLTEGTLQGYVWARLQAAAWTTVWYALLTTLILGFVGLLLTLLLMVVRRRAAPPLFLAIDSGLFAAAVAFVTWRHLYGGAEGLNPVLCAAGLLTGTLVGGLVYWAASWWETAASQMRLLRRLVRWTAPAIVLLCACFLLFVGLYRNAVRPALPARAAHEPATPERPNVVLFTVDALRADHLGIYGYDPAISPNIDALARRGAFFRQAIAQSSWTLPSVASMITGMYPTELDVYFWRGVGFQSRLDPMRTTLAEAFQAGGYYTGAFATNVWVSQDGNFHQGFDQFSGVRAEEPFDLDMLIRRPLLDLAWRCPFLHQAIWRSYYLLFDHRLTAGDDGLYVSIEALSFLQQHREERFFLWLYYLEPHNPYVPTAPFPSLPAGISQERVRTLEWLDYWVLVDSGPAMLLPDDIPVLVSLYDGEIHDMDYWVGAVQDELDRLNLSDRTLIVLHSDHGEEFADHGGYAHGTTLYDELLHVPLIIAGPGVVPSDQGIETPVALLDLLPTLLEAGGVTPPAESHGRSLWPLLQGETMDEAPIYAESLHTTLYDRKAVRYQGWKLVYGLVDQQVELYDLQHDPGERFNLAQDEPTRVTEYLQRLREWMAQMRGNAENLPRSLPPVESDERVRALLRQGGY